MLAVRRFVNFDKNAETRRLRRILDSKLLFNIVM